MGSSPATGIFRMNKEPRNSDSSNKPVAFIVGGTSGLGLELALKLASSHSVIVTGRRDPKNSQVTFQYLDLSSISSLLNDLDHLLTSLPKVDLFIYAAGFYQEGRINELSDEESFTMINVGLLAPALLLQRLLKKQSALAGFIAVTSSSQMTPRLLEPIYTAVKAGLGMLANSVSLDEHVGKVLVAAPAGMQTRFWENRERDISSMLDPMWVAEQILDHYALNFEYQLIRMSREPARVDVVEVR